MSETEYKYIQERLSKKLEGSYAKSMVNVKLAKSYKDGILAAKVIVDEVYNGVQEK